MPSWFDRAKKFVRNLTEIFSRNPPSGPEVPDWEEELEDSIEEARQVIMRHIRRLQPYGELEEAIKFRNKYGQVVWERPAQYPSQRTGHTPIEDGWFWETERGDRTLRVKIGNESQHFWAAVGEDYSGSWSPPGPLIFWWGPPQKWSPKTPWASNVRPPQFWLPWVDRNPPEYNPFWRKAMDEAMPEISGTIQEGMGDFLIEVFQRYGYRPA